MVDVANTSVLCTAKTVAIRGLEIILVGIGVESPMAKAKASSAKRGKPTVKARPAPAKKAKPAKSAKPSKPVKSAKAKGSAAPKAAKAAKSAKPTKPTRAAKPVKAVKAAAPVSPPAVVEAAVEESSSSGMSIKKKKVKRGAPPMLPRRLARRPLPSPGTPPLPPKATQPGSLHAPARSPDGAEGLKVRLMAVINLLGKLRGLKRSFNKQFWEAGLILAELSRPELYQAKGYGSWESFVEREIERELTIGRTTAEELRRIVRLFQREAAEELGFERLRGALRALFPEPGSAPVGATVA